MGSPERIFAAKRSVAADGAENADVGNIAANVGGDSGGADGAAGVCRHRQLAPDIRRRDHKDKVKRRILRVGVVYAHGAGQHARALQVGRNNAVIVNTPRTARALFGECVGSGANAVDKNGDPRIRAGARLPPHAHADGKGQHVQCLQNIVIRQSVAVSSLRRRLRGDRAQQRIVGDGKRHLRRRNAQIKKLNEVYLIRRRRHLYRRQPKAAARGYHRQCSVRREGIDNHFNASARKRGIGCEGVGANGVWYFYVGVADGVCDGIVGGAHFRVSGALPQQLAADVAIVNRHRHARSRGDNYTAKGANRAVKRLVAGEEVVRLREEKLNARGDGLRCAAAAASVAAAAQPRRAADGHLHGQKAVGGARVVVGAAHDDSAAVDELVVVNMQKQSHAALNREAESVHAVLPESRAAFKLHIQIADVALRAQSAEHNRARPQLVLEHARRVKPHARLRLFDNHRHRKHSVRSQSACVRRPQNRRHRARRVVVAVQAERYHAVHGVEHKVVAAFNYAYVARAEAAGRRQGADVQRGVCQSMIKVAAADKLRADSAVRHRHQHRQIIVAAAVMVVRSAQCRRGDAGNVVVAV